MIPRISAFVCNIDRQKSIGEGRGLIIYLVVAQRRRLSRTLAEPVWSNGPPPKSAPLG